MNNKYAIGYTTGVFDLFHIGHVNLLKSAKSFCDRLIVGVTTDELTQQLKGRFPVIPFDERIEIVKSIVYVDEVVPETKDDKFEAWERLRFNVIFKGDDWKGSSKWISYEERFKPLNVDIMFLQYTKHTSSSKLRHIIENF